MTRFKELRRIESAIEHQNSSELLWALGYCKTRVGVAPRREHQKHWRDLERKVQDALARVQAREK